jgi:glycine betaine/proline transport system ATP-binding protein
MRDGRIVQVGTPSELVLRPADPYVAEFTRDVPREKIVTAADVMDPAGPALDPAFAVSADAVIETVISRLVGCKRPLAVRGEGERILGQISVDRLLAALAQNPVPRP